MSLFQGAYAFVICHVHGIRYFSTYLEKICIVLEDIILIFYLVYIL